MSMVAIFQAEEMAASNGIRSLPLHPHSEGLCFNVEGEIVRVYCSPGSSDLGWVMMGLVTASTIQHDGSSELKYGDFSTIHGGVGSRNKLEKE
jgi:hypothetical protein